MDILLPKLESKIKDVHVTPGVNFINILRAAFTCADPKSTKMTVKLSVFVYLSGSALEKADRRMFMKLTLGRTPCPFLH